MKVEEIKLALKKNQEVKISLTLIDDVSSMNSKATDSFLAASKLAQQSAQEYAQAAQIAAQAESLADKGIAQAKELGADSLLKDLMGWKKGLGERIKRANKAEATIKAIN